MSTTQDISEDAVARQEFNNHAASHPGEHFTLYYSIEQDPTLQPADRLFDDASWNPNNTWAPVGKTEADNGRWTVNQTYIGETIDRVRALLDMKSSDVNLDSPEFQKALVIAATATPGTYKYVKGIAPMNSSRIAGGIRSKFTVAPETTRDPNGTPYRKDIEIVDKNKIFSLSLLSQRQYDRACNKQNTGSRVWSSPRTYMVSCELVLVEKDANSGKVTTTHPITYLFPRGKYSPLQTDGSRIVTAPTADAFRDLVIESTDLPRGADMGKHHVVPPVWIPGETFCITADQWPELGRRVLESKFGSGAIGSIVNDEPVRMFLSTRASEDPNEVGSQFQESSYHLQFKLDEVE